LRRPGKPAVTVPDWGGSRTGPSQSLRPGHPTRQTEWRWTATDYREIVPHTDMANFYCV
jgi:hypothetical protein